MNASGAGALPKISLLVSDVDGTLVTKDKILTERTCRAVEKIHEAGIKFAITSSRPPSGMRMFVEPLKLETPLGAYNGGLVVRPDMSVISEHTLALPLAKEIIEIINKHSLGVWVYVGNDWFVQSGREQYVEREKFVIKVAPHIVNNFDGIKGNPGKIVGVSEKFELVEQCEKEVQKQFGSQVSASRSQPQYLDITHPKASKGLFIETLLSYFSIDREEVVTIGDGGNDLSMFKQSGKSIAMANGSDELKRQATYVTDSNEEDGFAKAVEKYVLGALVSS
ncbi:MAG: Cof-type HAD-IIB family hydrolase [Candidatus Melainabacteria bacterium]|nr:MAG: Cof-type HAD-IIB family hydrolase [Candidatus Melainabacteria bacterium]